MAEDGYSWWMRRIAGASRLYDALRIDHFRGFESYWAVPADAPTAITGSWEKGPGMDFVGKLTEQFPETEFLAEDLGILTDEVRELLRDSKLPGMKVLEFAFSPDTLSDYLMHGHIPNSVCYCGTHDNTTLLAWRDEMSEEEYAFLCEYLALDERTPFNWALLRCGMRSVSQLFVAQLQDYLGLGAEGRINLPGTREGNWQWRLQRGQLSEALAEKIARMVYIYGREAEHEQTDTAAEEDL